MLNIVIMTVAGCFASLAAAVILNAGDLQALQIIAAYLVGGLIGASIAVLRMEWVRQP
ncbi:MAG: hypothetical protein ACK5M4_01310 [Pseudorhodobacter sp.]